MEFINALASSLSRYKNNNAFFINEVYYSYNDLSKLVSKLRIAIRKYIQEEDKIVGVVANGDFFTYASILALWFEGKAYVALNPRFPLDRNELIIEGAGIKSILNSGNSDQFEIEFIISPKDLEDLDTSMSDPKACPDSDLSYIIFTSGTTGVPKGVPISRLNLDTFLRSFWDMGCEIDEDDRCLQFAELTFDFSIVNFLPPLLKGACVYTIPENKMKFAYVYHLLEKNQLTVIQIVPSLLQYLRPYFDELHFPSLRYSVFGGEAVPIDLIQDWRKCAPNSRIYNGYGPTENTIYSSYYEYIEGKQEKSHNGILSIGGPLSSTHIILIDDKEEVISNKYSYTAGELWLSGDQLTEGYLDNKKLNNSVFKDFTVNGISRRYYRTGDLVRLDEEGDMLYLGRIDHQVQIQGFRVEMSEIEFHAKSYLVDQNLVVLPEKDVLGSVQIALVVEGKETDKKGIILFLSRKLPDYMVPKKVIFLDKFPLNINGKLDRNVISEMIK